MCSAPPGAISGRKTHTGATLYEFSYASGRLSQLTNVNGNTTRVERDGAGQPTAIVAPFGQRTALRLDASGDLDRITHPTGAAVTFTYRLDGLMETMVDARQQTYQFTYDAQGRLLRDGDPAGGAQELTRSGAGTNYVVSKPTALGRATRYQVERLDTGGTRRTVTAPDGAQSVREKSLAGTVATTRADGTVIVTQQGPDPRFGMPAAVPMTTTVTTPGGLMSITTAQREVRLEETHSPPELRSQTDTVTINGRA